MKSTKRAKTSTAARAAWKAGDRLNKEGAQRVFEELQRAIPRNASTAHVAIAARMFSRLASNRLKQVVAQVGN